MRAKLLLSILAAALAAGAQSRPSVKELATGKFLIARRDLPDPNFESTVVVLAHYDEKGAMGLILNRESEVPVARVFPEQALAKTRKDLVFIGGPVGRSGVFALVRATERPGEARRVLGQIYLVNSKADLDRAVANGVAPGDFRVFLGYSGWGPGQLEREVKVGSWHIVDGEPSAIFDSEPATLWLRLIRRTEARFALAANERK